MTLLRFATWFCGYSPYNTIKEFGGFSQSELELEIARGVEKEMNKRGGALERVRIAEDGVRARDAQIGVLADKAKEADRLTMQSRQLHEFLQRWHSGALAIAQERGWTLYEVVKDILIAGVTPDLAAKQAEVEELKVTIKALDDEIDDLKNQHIVDTLKY